jgi:hypothetical protein
MWRTPVGDLFELRRVMRLVAGSLVTRPLISRSLAGLGGHQREAGQCKSDEKLHGELRCNTVKRMQASRWLSEYHASGPGQYLYLTTGRWCTPGSSR